MLSKRQIQPGDVVRIKSGGPAMTVIKKVPATWECTWFDGAESRSATFVELNLVGSSDPEQDDPWLKVSDSSESDFIPDPPQAMPRGPDSSGFFFILDPPRDRF